MTLMTLRPMSLRIFLLSSCETAVSADAQDTRKVEEPKIPRSCTTLKAALKAVNNTLAPEDETKLDTDRIQKALDHCKAGMAVELRGGSKDKDAFLSGPLDMRSGVTLLVDKGVTLYGSRDAALYEMKGEGVTGGLCGTIATGGAAPVFPAPQRPAVRGGCRPLIGVDHATNVGIMGDGVIDGRGWAQMDKDYSWWQMSAEG